MEKRRFGKTNEYVSPLGFGCMRLPVIDGKYGQIHEKEAIAQIRYGIDKGINFIDTAYPYHEGTSEQLVAKALKDGYREKVMVSTKLPSWLIQSREDMDKYLNQQLENLQVDCIDFYLVHALNKNYWANLVPLGLFEFLESAKADGRIKHIGFSFHDEHDLFMEIVDSYDWEFCLIQHNFMDVNYQAGAKGLEYAASKDMGIMIMEPLRGGTLVNTIPKDVQAIWDSVANGKSPAQWALGYLWNKPQVSVVLSGMNDYSQLDENIEEAVRTRPNAFSNEEVEAVAKVRDIYLSRTKVNCTNCKYCMPCPVGVDIPTNFIHYNNGYIFEDLAHAKEHYNIFIGPDKQAHNCVGCGKCEKACPQNIKIIGVLKDVAAVMSN